jgi:phosphoribosylformimino-5-aminoimidazole carboxamide ribotide isomerase
MRSPSFLQVVPVLDVLGGRVVRAVRGERAAYRPIVSSLVAGSAPVDVARALVRRSGSGVLYVADLDALQGGRVQLALLEALLDALPGLVLWVDAGLRDAGDGRRLCDALGPCATPVFGSESLADVGALDAFPDAVLSLDSRRARPLDPAGIWAEPARWPGTVVVMTLDRVGAAAGPDLEAFGRLRAQAPDRRWIGAGGVRDAADLAAAAAAGADGWLVASALHDGGLDAR